MYLHRYMLILILASPIHMQSQTALPASQAAQFMRAGQVQPPSTALDKEGPVIGGLQIGMDQAEFIAAYGDKQGRLGNDAVYGRHIEVSSLPHEEGQYVTMKASIYITPKETPPAGKVFMIDRVIAKDSTLLLEPDDTINIYSTIVQSLSQSYPVLDSSQKDVPFPFSCENGGSAARQYIDWLDSRVSQGADINELLPANKRVVLAMHCGAVPVWHTQFKLNSRVRIFVAVDVGQGGGMHAAVLESVFDQPASDAMRAAIQKIHNQ
jgi:hypothetical protein